ncbi:universal stress protein [Fodinibacter luteus]|uniref:Universal stress protein n=1 Tax=Fodinibacter luteus TaxID=552064 RepID=A0ABP8KQV9_9MICO
MAGAVLVALDGSSADGPVLDWAADEAARTDAPLRLVTAIDPGVQLTPYEAIASGSPSLAEHLDESAHQLLGAAAERARRRHRDLDIATNVPWGPAAAAIVRLSEGARLVVVGAPARGLLDRILLGSVALPVVAHARCPIAVVPADTAVTTLRRIVVGVDGSEASAHAVELAVSTARASGAAVTCVVGWNLEVQDGVVVTEPGSERWAAVEQRYSARGHHVVDPVVARHPGVDVTVEVRHGTPAKVIAQTAAELDADLVVVGSRGLGGFRGLLLGSVSRRVVEHAGRVVVVVR